MLKQITNGRILTAEGWLEGGSVIVDGGKILEVSNNDLPVVGAEIIDAKGCDIVPGGIELHIHGGGGRDFMEGTEDAFRTAVDAHMHWGTTAIFPTLSSSKREWIDRAIKTCEKLMAEPGSPIMGLHLEGPYFNLKKAGAQMPDIIRNPDKKEYEEIFASTNCIKRWDAAPELPGAEDFFKCCVKNNCVASIAHTDGGWEDVKRAYDAGARLATHFTNAMSMLRKDREFKQVGVVESVFALKDFNVEVICDGIHVPPVLVREIFNAKGVDNMCLITDSLAVSAIPEGSDVDPGIIDPRTIIEDGVCKLSDRSALAGSISTMDRLVRTAVQEVGISMLDACRMIGEMPARFMGIDDRKGFLKKGYDADIIMFDQDQQLKFVMQNGNVKRCEL